MPKADWCSMRFCPRSLTMHDWCCTSRYATACCKSLTRRLALPVSARDAKSTRYLLKRTHLENHMMSRAIFVFMLGLAAMQSRAEMVLSAGDTHVAAGSKLELSMTITND